MGKCIHLLDVPVVPVIFLNFLFQMPISTKKLFIHKAYYRIEFFQASTYLRKYPLLFNPIQLHFVVLVFLVKLANFVLNSAFKKQHINKER